MIRRSSFYKNYKISNAKPVDIARHFVQVSSFCDTICDFLNNDFTGLVETICEPIWDPCVFVRISEDYTAYFLKLLLATIYGRDSVKIDMLFEDEVLTISISADGHLPIEGDEMNELVRTLRSTGFSFKVENDRITVFAPVYRLKKSIVQSMSLISMREKLVEIFYTGGPIVDPDE